MNRSSFITVTLLSLLAAPLATGQPPSTGGKPRTGSPGAMGVDRRMVGHFLFDLTELGDPPPPQLPDDPLGPEDFELQAIVDRLLEVQESFDLVEITADREFYESPNWFLERDPLEGSLLALRKPTQVDPQPQDESKLRADSRRRLAGFGILGGEVSQTLQRRLMRQDEDQGQIQEPEIHRYKTFVMRGINGVEVEGNRAVVTHHLDGSFNRVWLKWPALAPFGHRLRTDFSESDVIVAAYMALLQEGENTGEVRLRWKYVPTLLPDGQVELELMVGARLRLAYDGPLVGEPREIDVPVEAY